MSTVLLSIVKDSDYNFRVYRKNCVKFKNKPSYDKIKMS